MASVLRLRSINPVTLDPLAGSGLELVLRGGVPGAPGPNALSNSTTVGTLSNLTGEYSLLGLTPAGTGLGRLGLSAAVRSLLGAADVGAARTALGLSALATATVGSGLTLSGGVLSASGGGAVASVFGRTGAVVAQAGDYTASQISGLGTLSTLSAAPAGTLTGTTLAANVVSSSLTSVGTLTGLAVSGDITTGGSCLTTADRVVFGRGHGTISGTGHYVDGRGNTCTGSDDSVVLGLGCTSTARVTFVLGRGSSSAALNTVNVGNTNTIQSTAGSGSVACGVAVSLSGTLAFGFGTSLTVAHRGSAFGESASTEADGDICFGVQSANLSTNGPFLKGQRNSSTQMRTVGGVSMNWADSTDATRAGRIALIAYSTTTPQEGVRVDANAAGVRLGFYGSSASTRPSDLSGLAATGLVNAATLPLSGLQQSGAATNQVPQWNGTAWVPATVSGGGGGALTVYDCVVTLPNNTLDHEQTITNASISTTSRIEIWVAPHTDNDENGPEGLDAYAIWATPASGQMTVKAAFRQPAAGPIKLHYTIGVAP